MCSRSQESASGVEQKFPPVDKDREFPTGHGMEGISETCECLIAEYSVVISRVGALLLIVIRV